MPVTPMPTRNNSPVRRPPIDHDSLATIAESPLVTIPKVWVAKPREPEPTHRTISTQTPAIKKKRPIIVHAFRAAAVKCGMDRFREEEPESEDEDPAPRHVKAARRALERLPPSEVSYNLKIIGFYARDRPCIGCGKMFGEDCDPARYLVHMLYREGCAPDEETLEPWVTFLENIEYEDNTYYPEPLHIELRNFLYSIPGSLHKYLIRYPVETFQRFASDSTPLLYVYGV